MPAFIRGATSKTIMLVVLDSSTGLPKTGLANTDVATARFVKTRSLSAGITVQSLAGPSAAYASGGFVEIDATNMPGLYRFDLPNTALTGTPDQVVVYLTFTPANTNAQPVQVDMNVQDFTDQALEVDTIAELAQAAPAVNPTIKTAIMLVYMMLRNKTISSPTELKIHNDADVVISKATDAFTTEFTRAKLVSGP